MDNEHFPHEDLGGDVPELYLMDVYPLNYHINFQKWDWLRSFIDLSSFVRFEDDFKYYVTGDFWTGILSTSGAIAVGDGVNGVIVLTTHTDAGDSAEIYQTNETWRLYNGFPFYWESRLKITTGATQKFYAGMGDANGEYAVGFGHGVYFMSDGDGNLDFKVEDSTVVASVDTGVDLEDLTWLRLGFHWDGAGNLRWFVFDDDKVCLATGTVTTGFAQDEEMGLACGAKTVGGAVSLYVDYVKAGALRYVA